MSTPKGTKPWNAGTGQGWTDKRGYRWRFALLPCSHDETRSQILKPFAATLWGRKWAVGTDGKCMAAFLHSGQRLGDGPPIARIFPPEWRPTHTALLSNLRAWAGKAPKVVCSVCLGDGLGREGSDGEDCCRCGGFGWITARRPSSLLGVTLDRNFVARVLLTAPVRGRAELLGQGVDGAVVLLAQDWLAAVMPLRWCDHVEPFERVRPIGRKAQRRVR